MNEFKTKLLNLRDRYWPILRPYWLKFYLNKKIFLPVSIVTGLLLLTIIAGLLFGGKRPVSLVKPTPSPTPIVEAPPTAAPASDVLSQIEQQLAGLKTQIDALDVKESRLQPPNLDFKISF